MTVQDIEELVNKYGQSLYAFCCHLTGHRQDADDLYQDTFLKAIELRHKLDRSGNVKSYLIGISINLWRNQRRKNLRRQYELSLDADDNVQTIHISDGMNLEEDVLKAEIRKEMKCLTDKLPEKLRLVMYMYYTSGMQSEEIANALHIPNGTVRSRMHKARKIIKNGLEAKGYEL